MSDKKQALTCRAAVLQNIGGLLAIRDIDIDRPGPGKVLVRIGAAGLCHTDLEAIDGQLVYPLPIVLGHEAAGTVVDVGLGIDPSRIGEKVVLSWNPHCGHCLSCERGQPILCDVYLREGPRGRQLDGETSLRLDGAPLATMFFVSGFAEYAIVDNHAAIAIPAEMPLDRACLIGCAVMTGVGAATQIAQVSPGESVLVIGCGAVGLAAIQGARMAGARTIIAVDPQHAKLEIARTVGATDACAPEDALAMVGRLSQGGVDAVIECAGRQAALRLSVEGCRPGGRVVWLGKLGSDDEVTFRWGALMGEKRLVRSSYGGAIPARDFPLLCTAYLDGRLQLDPLISARIGLDDINAGFAALRREDVIRSVVMF